MLSCSQQRGVVFAKVTKGCMRAAQMASPLPSRQHLCRSAGRDSFMRVSVVQSLSRLKCLDWLASACSGGLRYSRFLWEQAHRERLNICINTSTSWTAEALAFFFSSFFFLLAVPCECRPASCRFVTRWSSIWLLFVKLCKELVEFLR